MDIEVYYDDCVMIHSHRTHTDNNGRQLTTPASRTARGVVGFHNERQVICLVNRDVSLRVILRVSRKFTGNVTD